MRSMVNTLFLLAFIAAPAGALADTYALKIVSTASSSDSAADAKSHALDAIYNGGTGSIPAAAYNQIPAFSNLTDAKAYCVLAGQNLVKFPLQGSQDSDALTGSAVPYVTNLIPFQNPADHSTSVDNPDSPTTYGAALEFLLNCS